MAKFLKSFFHPEKRSHRYEGPDEEQDDHPPSMEGRRKLSVSRSGRMRQAQKKRLSLNLDLYGDDHKMQAPEKYKNLEYHVNPVNTTHKVIHQRAATAQSKTTSESEKSEIKEKNQNKKEAVIKHKLSSEAIEVKTPEEEIDKAFEVIIKT